MKMWMVFLLLDFLCPLFFIFLGISFGNKRGNRIVKESFFVLFLALLFAPVLTAFGTLTVMGLLSAVILLTQFVLVSIGEKA